MKLKLEFSQKLYNMLSADDEMKDLALTVLRSAKVLYVVKEGKKRKIFGTRLLSNRSVYNYKRHYESARNNFWWPKKHVIK